MPHPFYLRVDSRLKEMKSSRAAFARKYDYAETTLSNHWKLDYPPPGKVLVDLSQYIEKSLDYLVFGIKTTNNNKALKELSKILDGYSDRILWQIVGCVRRDLSDILKDEKGGKSESA